MTPLEQKTLSKYEQKKKELHAEVEREAQALATLQEQRDTAQNDEKLARKEEEQSKLRKKQLEKDIADLESTLEYKERQNENTSGVTRRQMTQQKHSEQAHKERVKGMELIFGKIKKKAEGLKDKAMKHDRLERENRELAKDAEKLEAIISKKKKELETLTIKAEKIGKGQQKEQERLEAWFKSLQKYESQINFYANRIARWYQERGLKLPIKYDPEAIRKLWHE